ncbi:hypothetical protein ACWEPC_57750, partial [Nonomuraea sp. NPDC004297]
ATALVPGAGAGLATALPLLVAGLGSGLVISPNQAITLSEVPPAGGGSAAGVLQTGQRLGSAIGIAAVGSSFFASLNEGWPTAFRHGLVVVVSSVCIALAAALYDLVRSRADARDRVGPTDPRHRSPALDPSRTPDPPDPTPTLRPAPDPRRDPDPDRRRHADLDPRRRPDPDSRRDPDLGPRQDPGPDLDPRQDPGPDLDPRRDPDPDPDQRRDRDPGPGFS